METTLLGIVTDVRPQPWKAPLAILVTELGIAMEVRSLKPQIELYPIDVTEFGMIVVLHPAINSFVAVSIIALQLLRESYTVFPLSTIIDVRLLQLINGLSPFVFAISVTELGIVTVDILQLAKALPSMRLMELGSSIDVRPVQSIKASYCISVTLLGKVMEVRPLRPSKAPYPMEVTLLGMIVFVLPAINVFDDVSIIALQLSRESYFILPLSTSIELRTLQP